MYFCCFYLFKFKSIADCQKIVFMFILDPIVGYKVRRDITFSLEKFFKSVYEECGYNPNAAGIPLKVS